MKNMYVESTTGGEICMDALILRLALSALLISYSYQTVALRSILDGIDTNYDLSS